MVLTKVALTGASGMVGRHVIAALTTRGIACIAASRRQPKVLPPNSQWNHWNLNEWKDPEELDKLFPDVEAVLHVGAFVPTSNDNRSMQLFFDTNVRASLCLGEWALERGVPLVFLSGSIVYSEPERSEIVETDPKGKNELGGHYGFSKLLAEGILQRLVSDGLKLCILRPSSVYGYGQPDGKMISSFFKSAYLGTPIELFPPVDDKIDLIHADDVAIAMIDALEKEAWGVFNIASGAPSTVLEIAETCVRVVGNGTVIVISDCAHRAPIVRFGLLCDAAREAFGFVAKTNLEEGLGKMWHNMKENISSKGSLD